jgi:hypothetical protein
MAAPTLSQQSLCDTQQVLLCQVDGQNCSTQASNTRKYLCAPTEGAPQHITNEAALQPAVKLASYAMLRL